MRRVVLIGITMLALALAVPAMVFGASSQGLPGLDIIGSGFSQDAEPDAEAAAPKPWIGALLVGIHPRMAKYLNLDEGASGLVVVRVKDGSPAAEAGLQRGDLVVQIDGVDVEKARDAREIVKESSPGDTLTFSIRRTDGEDVVEMDIAIVVGDRPQREDRPRPRWSPLLRIAMALAPGLQHAEITTLDGDGNPVDLSLVAGTVSGAVEEGILTVSLSDGSEDLSLTLGDETRIFGKGGKVDAEDLEDGDEVIIAKRNGELVAVLLKPLGRSKGKSGRRYGWGENLSVVVGDGPEVALSRRLGRAAFRGGAQLRSPELRDRARGPQVQERFRGRGRGGEGALRGSDRTERVFRERGRILEELQRRQGSRLDDLLGQERASEEESNDAPAANPSNSDLVV